MISRGERFIPDADFPTLNPIYAITPKDIEIRIKTTLEKIYNLEQ